MKNNFEPNLLECQLGGYQSEVENSLEQMKNSRIIERLWSYDYTLWKPEATEIQNRMGWITSHESMNSILPSLFSFCDEIRDAGYTHALLLGMGGSSLAPELFSKIFGKQKDYLDLIVLDSTHPDEIASIYTRLEDMLDKTLFIVSTKSGTTIETLSLFEYFYDKVRKHLGQEQCGKHFIAITDPNSDLAAQAKSNNFRSIFLNDPNIGGRYSALSLFGLVPAVLCGANLLTLLERAKAMARNNQQADYSFNSNNHAVLLGAILGTLAKKGRDKLTLITSQPLTGFSDWLEQLIAESTGKEGKGILPVVGEPFGNSGDYGNDRLFVYLQLKNDKFPDSFTKVLKDSAQPSVFIRLNDIYDLGGQFFLWEMATAIAGHILEINPFDQPNVEAAKVLARKMVITYQESGQIPKANPSTTQGNVKVYSSYSGKSPLDILVSFLSEAQPGAYVALQAYLQPTPDVSKALQKIRFAIRKRTSLATTMGYGPRYLHSTGQLHKGDAGKGLFIQLTDNPKTDILIPDRSGASQRKIDFGTLISAQALGDYQALINAGRKVIRFHFEQNVLVNLNELAEKLV